MASNESQAKRLVQSVCARIDMDLDEIESEVVTVFGQVLTLLDEEGRVLPR